MTTVYHDDGQITIHCADCERVLPNLAGIDLVFTSPPYNLGVNPGGVFGHWKDGDTHGGNESAKWRDPIAGIGYSEHEDAMPQPEYEAWQRRVLTMCWDTLTDAGAIFYNHKPRVQADTLWTPLVLNPGLPLRQIITWARSGGVCFTTTAYVPTYEWIMVLAKSAWRLKDKTTSGSGLGDVWHVPQERDNPHPAPFPVGLPGRAIASTQPSLVLDPFCGSGSTLRAALDAGVRAIGIERSEAYCEMAVNRLRQGSLFAV
jgi:site-specific DNA-methyltransferase (adenine-specific)